MIRFLLDEGLPLRAAGDLRARGLVCSHVVESGLAGQVDSFVPDMARREGRVVVTLDSDFSALLAESMDVTPSVIHLRLQGMDRLRTVSLLSSLPLEVWKALEQGAVVSVTESGMRIRRLPLPGPLAP